MTELDRSPSLTLEDAATALRTLPYGGLDDAARSLRLPPAVQATVSPVIMSIRWGAAMFGMVFAATRAEGGDAPVVATLAVVLFLTTWRTLRPIRLGSARLLDRALPFSDALIVGLAVGWSDALASPFVFCILAAAAVAAFGWGVRHGLAALALALLATGVVIVVDGDAPPMGNPELLTLLALVAITTFSGFVRKWLLDAESRRAGQAHKLDVLAETNDLLHLLNRVARTLPESLDLREAVTNTRDELVRSFGADTVALIVRDDLTGEWTPQIAEGCALRPSSPSDELPSLLRKAIVREDVLLVPDLGDDGGVSSHSRSGLYAPLRTRGRLVGAVAIESSQVRRYGGREERLLEGFSDVLALTVDNARSFRRLRSLGADAERTRIARDLHDRLGQWLSFISLELERIITNDPAHDPELDQLYGDVQKAIEELRETLRNFRSSVTAERPLAVVAQELIERFNRGSTTVATFEATDPAAHLPVPVENELLRVLQEALSNVAKHARAQTVNVTWTVKEATGVLVVKDDGRGFDPVRGVRESAYGLVGMRERADGVDARLTIDSAPGKGTTVTVVAGRGVDQWRQAEHPAAAEAQTSEHEGQGPARVTNGVTTA